MTAASHTGVCEIPWPLATLFVLTTGLHNPLLTSALVMPLTDRAKGVN